MSKFLKVENESNLVRDVQSRAIINTSSSDYDKYMKRKNAILEQKKEVDELKLEVSEIKDLLKQLLDKV